MARLPLAWTGSEFAHAVLLFLIAFDAAASGLAAVALDDATWRQQCLLGSACSACASTDSGFSCSARTRTFNPLRIALSLFGIRKCLRVGFVLRSYGVCRRGLARPLLALHLESLFLALRSIASLRVSRIPELFF